MKKSLAVLSFLILGLSLYLSYGPVMNFLANWAFSYPDNKERIYSVDLFRNQSFETKKGIACLSKFFYWGYFNDAFFSKGMVTILCDIFGGNEPKEISNTELKLLDELQLNTLLTPGRRNGVYSMLLKIKEHAKSHCK